MSEVTDLSEIEKSILKILETKAAKDGLSDIEIYRVLAELQKQGKLKAIVNYEAVKNVLNKLKAEGKVKCKEDLCKPH